MATPVSGPENPEHSAIPVSLLNVCFVLCVINAAFFPAAFFAHCWIFDELGRGSHSALPRGRCWHVD